jgi:SAM-dependent methyltransferase
MNPRLPAFLARCVADVYPESPSELHTELTARQARDFAAKLAPGALVLDVGCGQGPAMRWFVDHGFCPLGIGLGADVEVCVAAGLQVIACDQNEMLDDWDRRFDAVWARHVAEHSPIPFFTLTEFFRVLKPGGWLYLEMPAPDTVARHSHNQNHYSVLTPAMWSSLLLRAGFIGAETYTSININLAIGPDLYFAFTVQKPKL